jgi:hypothetical protein
MSRISLVSAVNTLVSALPQTIRNIDLRVAGCAALALGTFAYFFLRGYSFNPFALPESKPNYGFSEEMLNRTIVVDCGFKDALNRPATIQSTFRQVCESVFPSINSFIEEMDRPPGSNASPLRPLTDLINSPSDDVGGDGTRLSFYSFVFSQSAIRAYLNWGLPEGVSYITASDDVKQQSWVHQILQQYRDERKISSFKFDNAGTLTITK